MKELKIELFVWRVQLMWHEVMITNEAAGRLHWASQWLDEHDEAALHEVERWADISVWRLRITT